MLYQHADDSTILSGYKSMGSEYEEMNEYDKHIYFT